MNLVIWAIATIGLADILVRSAIAQPIRDGYDKLMAKSPKWVQEWLGGLFGCHQCCGFWSGLICAVLLGLEWWLVLPLGFAGSFLAPFGVATLSFIDVYTSSLPVYIPDNIPPEQHG